MTGANVGEKGRVEWLVVGPRLPELSEYLSTQPGGEAVDRFIKANLGKGDFLVVGSVAELLHGRTDVDNLESFQNWWLTHYDVYPYRKAEVIDIDMFVLVDDGERNWAQPDGVDIGRRAMKNGQIMLLIGEKLPDSGNEYTRRVYFNDVTWAEIVPIDLKSGSVGDQLGKQGYTSYTSVLSVCQEKNGLGISGITGVVGWKKHNELTRVVGDIDGSNITEAMGKDTKYLKMAVKSLTNMALGYGKDLPKDVKNDLINLLKDRVELVREDWQEYCDGRGYGVASGLLIGDVLDMTANNSYLWINVIERMIDGWVILGKEATEIYKESGLLELVFGVSDGTDKNDRDTVLRKVSWAIEYAKYKNLVPEQVGRLKAELEGLHKLFSSPDLEI